MSVILVRSRPFSASTRVAAARSSWRVCSRRRSKRLGTATAVVDDVFMTEHLFSYRGPPLVSRGLSSGFPPPRGLRGCRPRKRRQAPEHDRSRSAPRAFHDEALSRLDREDEARLVG